MIVMKFGGSSLADVERLRAAVALVLAAKGRTPCIVLSAMANTTDALLAAAGAAEQNEADALNRAAAPFRHAREVAAAALSDSQAVQALVAKLEEEVLVLLRGVALLRELTARTSDAIVAHGERVATALFTAMLQDHGLDVTELDAREVVRTDDRFGRARPDFPTICELADRRINRSTRAGRIVVTQGYVGATAQGFTTTLGRGGSDWSAALLAAALGAEELQIWTDVEGVLSADPRTVAAARPVPVLSAAEAAELAAFGARVLHPATIQPAIEAGIAVTVRHTLKPHGQFTTIDPRRRHDRRGVAALAHRGPVIVLTMTSTRMLASAGYLARLFEVFGRLDICVDLVVTAEVSVACTVEPDAPLEQLVRALEGLARVEIARDCAIVAAVGEGLQQTPGTVERACRALHPITPQLVGMGGNARNMSLVVKQSEVDEAMRRLHAEFFSPPAGAANSDQIAEGATS
ncbi:MAG: aspartate kinase [bacterium]|nr:aspartate kinase [bacterium]